MFNVNSLFFVWTLGSPVALHQGPELPHVKFNAFAPSEEMFPSNLPLGVRMGPRYDGLESHPCLASSFPYLVPCSLDLEACPYYITCPRILILGSPHGAAALSLWCDG